MIIKSIRVQNLRSIKDETVPFHGLTALVGRNGTGKSSFLRAIDLFYGASARPSPSDFHDFKTDEPIAVSMTYTGLTASELERFGSRVKDGDMTVTRVFHASGGKDTGSYYGVSFQNADCKTVREQPSATDVKKAYDKLRESSYFEALPKVTGKANIEIELAKWEQDNSEACEWLLDDGHFFGFTNVANAYLGASTKFVYVPAVWDATEDAVQGKGSPFKTLTALVLDHIWHEHAALNDLRDETQKKFEAITSPENVPQLKGLSQAITETINTYYSGVSVDLEWQEVSPVNLQPPVAEPWIVEDKFRARVENVGHGLQRAFIISLLQRLALTGEPQPEEGGDADTPGEAAPPSKPEEKHLILAIEEPEIYQHPNQQRHLATVLHRLATDEIAGVASKVQVIYSTHCPLFVDIDRYEQIRLVRKRLPENGEGPKQTYCGSTNWTRVKERFEEVTEVYGKFTETSTHAQYHIMNPFISEGFFADVAVLVEGSGDRAAILATAEAIGIKLESKGVAVLPCEGKTKLSTPAVVFAQLGIPTYLVWDSDKNGGGDDDERKQWNGWLQKLAGEAQSVDWPGKVTETYACFEDKLETTLASELGEEYLSGLVSKHRKMLGLRDATTTLKNPLAMGMMIAEAAKDGKVSPTLKSIVENVAGLTS